MKYDYPKFSAIVTGKVIRRTVQANEPLGERLMQILQTQIRQVENSAFMGSMVAQAGAMVENIIRWLILCCLKNY